jgi:hypothetical protein
MVSGGKVRDKPLKNFILSDPYLCQSRPPPKIIFYDIIKELRQVGLEKRLLVSSYEGNLRLLQSVHLAVKLNLLLQSYHQDQTNNLMHSH